MKNKLLVLESASKPLAGVELHSLSRENRDSQDEYDMAVLGRAQELNVSTYKRPISRPRYKAKLSLNSVISASFRRWGSRAR